MMQIRRDFDAAQALSLRAEADRKNGITVSRLSMASRKILADYPESGAWICLQVRTGREMAVENSLSKANVEAWVPTKMGQEKRHRGRVIPAPCLPLLPGYVLACCVVSPAAILGLMGVRYVLSVIGHEGRPYRVPEKFIRSFKEAASEGRFDDKPHEPVVFAVGERVRIAFGPFAGWVTTLSGVDDKRNLATADFTLFGSSKPVTMDLALIEKL